MAWEARDWRALSGLPLEEVWLTAQDGMRLFGWYVEAPRRRGVLLWCHGNGGNIIHRLEPMQGFYRRGLSVFIFDYRGYGQSQGRPSERGTRLDARAAYAYLTRERKVAPGELILYGTSLGAAVAGELAAQHPAAGLILETPFPSIAAVAKLMYGGLPVHKLLEARYELAAHLKAVRMPVLVLHGDQDTIIPYALGQAVFEAANEPKRFYRIPGADHNDTHLVGGDAYFDTIAGFVREITGGR
jgi:fermentation-respiration switch protein FrsA (DUF1100 family)